MSSRTSRSRSSYHRRHALVILVTILQRPIVSDPTTATGEHLVCITSRPYTHHMTKLAGGHPGHGPYPSYTKHVPGEQDQDLPVKVPSKSASFLNRSASLRLVTVVATDVLGGARSKDGVLSPCAGSGPASDPPTSSSIALSPSLVPRPITIATNALEPVDVQSHGLALHFVQGWIHSICR